MVEQRLYAVAGMFPHLSPRSFSGGIPAGVESATYSVNLEMCPEQIVSTSPAAPGIPI